MIKPPFLTVVWVPFLAGTLSDTWVEHWDPRMAVAHCQRRSGLMRPGSHGSFSTRCGPGSGTSLHGIVYHWRFPKSCWYPPNCVSFSIGFHMKYKPSSSWGISIYGNPQMDPNGTVEITWDGDGSGSSLEPGRKDRLLWSCKAPW